ncbi:MAG: hypothetical protein R2702_12195 [Acidimicrobiales bacterium]
MLWNLIQEVELRNARTSRALSDQLHESRFEVARAGVDQLDVRRSAPARDGCDVGASPSGRA